MHFVGTVIIILGAVAILYGGVWMLVEQFRSGLLWFLGCMFIPFVSLIWLITHCDEGKEPFAIGTVGAIATFAGAAIYHI